MLAGLALAVLVLLTRGFATSTLTLIACLLAAGALYTGLTVALRVWNVQEIQLLNQITGGLWLRLPMPRLTRRPARKA